MVSVQYITETGGRQERIKKVEISVTVVCASVKIVKIRRMVNKMGGSSAKVCLPASCKIGRWGGGHHILLFCYLLNRDYRNTPNGGRAFLGLIFETSEEM